MPERSILFIHALTGLHPGSGTALGAVDLPVQRERHTQWPTIAGSALKGILRDACRERAKDEVRDDAEDRDGGRRSRRRIANEDHQMLVAAFGPGRIDESNAYAGALSVTDGRILAFPVRSLKGVFAWVTCPAVLERLQRDLELAGFEAPVCAQPGDGKALCASNSQLLIEGSKLVLEEFEFERTGDADRVADWMSEKAVDPQVTGPRVKTHLCALSDNDFTYFVRHATEVVARVGLDYETKTVKCGALFYQEFLPAETLLYSLVLATNSRREKDPTSATEVVAYLGTCLPPVLQIGGDETIGKGLCAVRLVNGKEK
jgi:CRISPR-associated protein Cmr4